MTTKRFTIDKKGGVFYLFDNGDLIPIYDGQPVCDLLNELHEENQDLKAFNQDLSEELSVCGNARISKDNRIERLEEKIKREIGHNQRLHQDNYELHKENEQLKSLNQYLIELLRETGATVEIEKVKMND